jgi:carbamoyl-phosphate synthase large subunit
LFDRIDYRTLSLEQDTRRDLKHDAPPAPRGRQTLPPGAQSEMVTAIERAIAVPTADRLFYVGDAIRAGISLQRIFDLTAIDPWFLAQMQRLVNMEGEIKAAPELSAEVLRDAKRLGFSDPQIAALRGLTQKCARSGWRWA